MKYEITYKITKNSVVRVEADTPKQAVYKSQGLCLDDEDTRVDLDIDYDIIVKDIKEVREWSSPYANPEDHI